MLRPDKRMLCPATVWARGRTLQKGLHAAQQATGLQPQRHVGHSLQQPRLREHTEAAAVRLLRPVEQAQRARHWQEGATLEGT